MDGSNYSATVQHMDDDFAVISLDDTAQLTVIQTTGHLNETQKVKLGKPLTAKVIEASCEELEGLPLVSWENTAPKRQRTLSDITATQSGYCYGETVKGTVRTVKATCVLVALEDGHTGSVHMSQVVEEVLAGSFPTSLKKVGDEVTGRVIGGREGVTYRWIPHTLFH